MIADLCSWVQSAGSKSSFAKGNAKSLAAAGSPDSHTASKLYEPPQTYIDSFCAGMLKTSLLNLKS